MTRTRTEVINSTKAATCYTSIDYESTGDPCSDQPSWRSGTVKQVRGSAGLSNETKSMTDVVTVGFKAISKRGGIVNSPMSASYINTIDPPITWDLSFTNYSPCTGKEKRPSYNAHHYGQASCSSLFGTSCSGTRYLAGSIPLSEISAAKDLAVTQAWANIDHSDVLALATLAESGKTVSGFTGTLKKVLKVVTRLRRKQFKLLYKDAKNLKAYLDIYMQARYEIRPLYYDAIGFLEAAKRTVPEKGSRETFRGYHEVTEDFEEEDFFPILTQNSTYNVSFPAKRVRKTHVSVNCRAGVLTAYRGVNHNIAFGQNKIPETMWELVPLSFVVDWFCNTGDLIKSWTPNAESTHLASWVTTEIVTTRTCSMTALDPVIGPIDPLQKDCRNPSVALEWGSTDISITKTREPNPKRSKLPHITVNLDPLKILDLGIIISNLKKVPRVEKVPKRRHFRSLRIPSRVRIG